MEAVIKKRNVYLFWQNACSVEWILLNVVHRLGLLTDATALATKLATSVSEMESWLDDVSAEDSVICVDHELFGDVEKLKLQRRSLTVRTLSTRFLVFVCDDFISLYFDSAF